MSKKTGVSEYKEIGASCEAPQTETIFDNRQNGHDCQAVREQAALSTLPNDQVGDVKALALKTGHSDHTFEQVWRNKTHAVYKHFGNRGQFIGWEAILIKIAPAGRIFGKDYPEREVYPSNEDFGRYALSVGAQYDLEHAIEKSKTLKVKNVAGRTGNQTGTGRRRTGTGAD